MSPFIHCNLDLRLHLAKLDLVDAGAHVFKANLDNVSVLEPQLRLASHSNTLRPWFSSVPTTRQSHRFFHLRSGENDITRQQGSALAQERDCLLDTKDHILGVVVLPTRQPEPFTW